MDLEHHTDLPSVLHLKRPRRRSQVPNPPEIDRGGLEADLWGCFLFLHIHDQPVKFLHGRHVFREVQDIAL